MPSDPDRLALDDGEKSDLDVITQLHVLSDHDAAEADAHAPSNAVTEEQSIGQHLQRAREPAEQNDVPPRDARFRKECFGHRGGNVRFDAL